jgi:hypothetical protein
MAVTLLASVGTRHEVIGQKIGVSPKTLRKYFAVEIAQATADVTALIGKTLVGMALSGNLTACIFYLKARAGWREVNTTEVTGAAGGPILLGRAGEPIADAATAAQVYATLIRSPGLDASGLVFAPPDERPVETRETEALPGPQLAPVALAEPVGTAPMDAPSDVPDNVVGLFTRLGK